MTCSDSCDRGLADPTTPGAPWPEKRRLLGLGVSVTDYDEAVECILRAARDGEPAVVSCQAVHAVVTASERAAVRERINRFELIAPDGQPVKWALNLLHRSRLSDRVYGPELMLRVCERAAARGVPIYLYGSTPDVLHRLQANLVRRFPGLRIAGAKSPPFRDLTHAEAEAMVQRIACSGARIVFVGLGCPKQDLFAATHRDAIARVLVCVGAAFDFHAGTKRIAPAWMQRHGLEWLFRLGQEPRRLWRRYTVTNAVFLARFALELIRVRLLGRPMT